MSVRRALLDITVFGAACIAVVALAGAPHAHSVAVDPATHRVYLPLQSVDGHPVMRIMAPAAAR